MKNGRQDRIAETLTECFSRTDLPPILRESFFLKDIFRLKHFTMHILQPEKKGVSACRYRYEKNNRSNF